MYVSESSDEEKAGFKNAPHCKSDQCPHCKDMFLTENAL
jgi:hypothetical protein